MSHSLGRPRGAMPRNDQITRQWHLLRKLEHSPGRTLQELVDNIPDDYPKNASPVRRDLEALEAVGFPLVTERRNGQTCLSEGFRDIPALGFSATELMAFLVSFGGEVRVVEPEMLREKVRNEACSILRP